MLPVYKAVDPTKPGGPEANHAAMDADPARWFSLAGLEHRSCRRVAAVLPALCRVGWFDADLRPERRSVARKGRRLYEESLRRFLTGVVLVRVYSGR